MTHQPTWAIILELTSKGSVGLLDYTLAQQVMEHKGKNHICRLQKSQANFNYEGSFVEK